MDEIKVPQPEEPTLVEKVDSLYYNDQNVIKKRPMKLPRGSKVRGRKAKKGWVGIVKIDENNVVNGEKVLLRDASFITKSDGITHATDGSEILWWGGKFPVFIQESKKNNPKNFKFNQGQNETYGQRYIRAKMLSEAIKTSKGGVGIIIWLLVIGGAIFLLSKLGIFGGG